MRLFRRQPHESSLSHLCIRLYTRAGCHLCDDAAQFLKSEQVRYQFILETVDVDAEPALRALHNDSVPVVTINGKLRFRGAVNPVLWRRIVRAEQQRA
jgi:glutaredoxin